MIAAGDARRPAGSDRATGGSREEGDDGIWDVYFGSLKLGRMDERTLRIEDHKGQLVPKTSVTHLLNRSAYHLTKCGAELHDSLLQARA